MKALLIHALGTLVVSARQFGFAGRLDPYSVEMPSTSLKPSASSNSVGSRRRDLPGFATIADTVGVALAGRKGFRSETMGLTFQQPMCVGS